MCIFSSSKITNDDIKDTNMTFKLINRKRQETRDVHVEDTFLDQKYCYQTDIHSFMHLMDTNNININSNTALDS